MKQGVILGFVLSLVAISVAFAQPGITCDPAGTSSGLPPCSILGTVGAPGTVGQFDANVGTPVTTDVFVATVIGLVNWFAWFVAVAAVVMGLYAGFLFITARGEAAQLVTARKTLTWAVIGIAVAILAFSIVAITKSVLLI